MIRPTYQVVESMSNVAKRFPEFLEFLRASYMHELEQLPNAVGNPTLAQGRCQVLGELYKLISAAPTTAAKPYQNGNGKLSDSTHTERSVKW